MGSTTFTTSSGFGLTGFDANTTALDTLNPDGTPSNFTSLSSIPAGVQTFILAEPTTPNTPILLWNWNSTTDGESVANPPGMNTPDGNPISSSAGNQQIVSEIGNDSWTLNVTFTQYGGDGADSMQATGDFLEENGTAFLTTNTVVKDADNNSATVSNSGANSLSSFIQQLGLVLNPNNGAETFGITFQIVDNTTSTKTTFTEVFGLSQTACYAAGTRIATPGGEVAVETLSIGDLVNTGSGIAKPVKWIGRRAYTAAQVAANAHVRPVLIRAGALAEGLPVRDLAVSPMHGLFIDDAFIPAAALVNGLSIIRVDTAAPVSFIHVELDDHDVIFAEGALAETFVDDNSRLMFDNADEYYDMYGADDALRGFSAPRIEEGYQLDGLRRSLAAQAGVVTTAAVASQFRGHVEHVTAGAVHGWVIDDANTGTPVELDILVEGEIIARVLANRYRADLDHAGLADGRCAFTVTLPASVTALDQVAVRLASTGVALPQPQVAALVH